MTKILYVSGGDYTALEFERARDAGVVDPKALWDQAVEARTILTFEDGETRFDYEARLFEDVDPDFIEFVTRELLDYDALKAANIYVVGE